MAAMAAVTSRRPLERRAARAYVDARPTQTMQQTVDPLWARIRKEHGMNATTVNVPLLRKAVEWAEAEAAKPFELCEWFQGEWVTTVEERETGMEVLRDRGWAAKGVYLKAPECGTCYCIAGYVAQAVDPRFENNFLVGATSSKTRAERELGLTAAQSDDLFAGGNSIEDVRRIAESIAGERL